VKVNAFYVKIVAVQAQPQRLKSSRKAFFFIEVKIMTIGEKLCEGNS